MSLNIRIPKHQLEDFKRIASLSEEKFAQVLTSLRQVEVPFLRPQQLLAELKGHLPSEDAEPLVRQLLAVNGLSRQSGLEIDELFASIRSAVELQGPEVGLQIEEWAKVENVFRELAKERSVRLPATAIELTYDYANLLRRTRILTDIRPIYDRDADKIEGAVVSFTLRLRYDSADGEHELSIALDAADIKELTDQCVRALRKASTARSHLERMEIAASIPGEESDGNHN